MSDQTVSLPYFDRVRVCNPAGVIDGVIVMCEPVRSRFLDRSLSVVKIDVVRGHNLRSLRMVKLSALT